MYASFTKYTPWETDLFERLQENDRLTRADAGVLAVADDAGGTAVMDQRYGRTVADAEGIQTRGAAYLVLRVLADGGIDADQARETIDDMMAAGWYCAPDLYARILDRIDDLG